MDIDILGCLYYTLALLLLSAATLFFRAFIYPILYWVFVWYKIKWSSRFYKWKNRPFNMTKHRCSFLLNEDEYSLWPERHVPRSLFDLVVITDGTKDVSQRVLAKAGPYANFYGLRVTPSDLGLHVLYINHQLFGARETIPPLTDFV